MKIAGEGKHGDMRKMAGTRKGLMSYRLQVARSILRNEMNILLIQGDMQEKQHITELCDQYSLQMLVNWLATKCGFPRYSLAIEEKSNSSWTALESWPALFSVYPFAIDQINLLSKETVEEVFEQLDMYLSPSVELIGTLYEEINGAPLMIDEVGVPYIQRGKNRRLLGQFFTPLWLVRYCFDLAFREDSESLMSEIKAAIKCRGSAVPDNGYPFHMLDPACGTGNFLVGAVEWLRQNGLEEDELEQFVPRALYGIEVDGRAASLTRIALLLSLSQVLKRYVLNNGYRVANELLSDWLENLRKHIVVLDSLYLAGRADVNPQVETIAFSAQGIGAVDFWPREFLSRFDLVVGNPPYVSYGSRNQEKPLPSIVEYCRKSYPDATQYKIRLNAIFQEIALRYARFGGRIVLLVPDAFLSGRFYERLRAKIIDEARICSISEFRQNVIDQATVGRWCVANYKRQPKALVTNYDVTLSSFLEVNEMGATLKAQPNFNSHPTRCYTLPINILISKDRSRFQLLFCDEDKEIWTKLDSLPGLGKYLKGHTGIRCRNGQKTIVAKVQKGSSFKRGIISGAQVTRHRVEWDGNWLNVDPSLLYAGGFDPEVVCRPKLLVRQTADKLIAAVDESGLYHLNNVHSFCPRTSCELDKEVVDLYFFDGLLNSSFWLYLYALKARESGRALAQIDIEMVESMPAPPFGKLQINYVSSLVKNVSLLCKGENKKDHRLLPVVDRAIDWLVYDLYNLTGKEISHIENHIMSTCYSYKCLPKKDAVLALVERLSNHVQKPSANDF